MRRVLLAAVPLAPASSLTACDDDEERVGSDDAGLPAAPAKGFPAMRVTTVLGGLDHPWDVKPIGKGRLLVTERDRARVSLVSHGTRHTVAFPSRVWVSGETGLLGMAVDPAFSSNHRVNICQVLFMKFDATGHLSWVKVPAVLTTSGGCARSRPCRTAASWSPPTTETGTTGSRASGPRELDMTVVMPNS